jgi:hypothetical protein
MDHRRIADKDVAVAATKEGEQPRQEEGDHDEVVIPDVRASDIEPYTGLRYLSKLFRVMAVIIILLLVAEVITGLAQVGSAAIPTLLGEASRLLVLAGLLWGAGDLAILLIDVGHDVRAARVLISRQTYAIKQQTARNGALADRAVPAASAAQRNPPEVR